MKAQDMAQAVYTAEMELIAELSKTINIKLASLSEETGLILGDIEIRTSEVTAIGDKARQWIVTSVRIDYWLPDPVRTE